MRFWRKRREPQPAQDVKERLQDSKERLRHARRHLLDANRMDSAAEDVAQSLRETKARNHFRESVEDAMRRVARKA